LRAKFGLCVAFAVALVAGCGGGDDAASGTTVREPLTCISESTGLRFTTQVASCDQAFAKGHELATELELATGPETPAAETAHATTCSTIQGAETKTFETPKEAEFAERLNSLGICAGDPTMLVAPTTAPTNVLVETAGWTLVDVIDGDTLDVTSAVEGQRRIDLIGINAPEPGECMADQATNALRFVATDHELKLVPDQTDANAEGNNVRYVEQVGGVDLGATMIELGLAIAQPVEPDIARGGEYAQKMTDAQTAAVGMWAPGACPPPTVPATTPATTAVPAPATSAP
jgi:endonuclease YncB( thermonuclease family)